MFYTKKRFKHLLSTFTCVLMSIIFVASTMMATLAWSDFTQSKTNVFKGTVKTTSVILHKTEKNQDGNNTGKVVPNARFKLFMEQGNGANIQLPGIYITDSKGQIRVHDLNVGKYYFEETHPSFGYEFDKDGNDDVTKYKFAITTQDAETAKVVEVEAWNRRLENDENALEIIKQVTGIDPLPTDKEFTFIVTFKNGNSIDNTTYYYNHKDADGNLNPRKAYKSGEEIKLKHNEMALFNTLPVGLQYSVVEKKDDAYTTSSKGANGHIREDETAEVEFTNDHGVPSGNGELEITKKIRGEYPEADKDKDFWFTLEVEGEQPIRFSLTDLETKKFDFPAGKHFTVTEDDYFNDGYVLIPEYTYNTSGTVTDAKIEILFTNGYNGIIYIDPSGEKTWDMSKAPQGLYPPAEIEVQLINKKTGEVDQVKTVRPDSDGKWQYAFTAPKYDEKGEEIEWTVKEIPMGEYISEVDGMDIKNTYNHLEPVEYVPQAEKKITGDKPSKSNEFTFKLKGENTDDTAKVTGAGIAKFKAIKFTKAGTYSYKINEVKGTTAGYTYDTSVYTLTIKVEEKNNKLSITSAKYTKDGKDVDGAVFTNKYKTTEKITISGKKTWKHGDNPKVNRPTSITVLLKNGSKTVEQKTVTASNGWKWSFTVDKYDANGKTIKYTIDEKKVKDYGKKVNGYNITNTFGEGDADDPNGRKIKVSGQKTWDYKDASNKNKPESITVILKNGDKTIAQKIANAETDWIYVFVVPERDKNGKKIKYSITEKNVKYYTASYDGYNIKNTYKGTDYPGDNPGDGSSGDTGDDFDFTLWFVFMIVSGAGAIMAFIISRKYSTKRYKKRR